MKHSIEHRERLFGKGINLIVRLEFDEREREIIRKNSMERILIVEQEPEIEIVVNKEGKKETIEHDTNVYFADLYQRRTSWPTKSRIEARDFHAKLFEGLKRFEAALEQNGIPSADTSGNFDPVPPPDFSLGLVPEHMWAEHTYVLAESGGGKTQLLQTIFALQMQKKRPPGFLVIDSQNQMLQLIKEKFPSAIMIDPLVTPISLDLFNPTTFDNESALAPTLDTFRYLFSAGSQPLTDRQYTPFAYAIALLLVGYPRAFGQHATIEDFEDYLNGAKKGKELTTRAHTAVDKMDDDVKAWYYNQYGNFTQSHSEILQRLSNICGPFTPLRPLFMKQHQTLNIADVIDNGGILLINTNRHALGPAASSFFGRFFFKMLDRQIGARDLGSHPLMFMVDEVHEYFDAAVIQPFVNLARKRNIACLFASQRLGDIPAELRDSLTGLGTLMATYVNKADVREVAEKFGVEREQVHAWRKEYVEAGRTPRYSDFGLYYRGKQSADTFRLPFFQLEKLPAQTKAQQQHSQQRNQEKARSKPDERTYTRPETEERPDDPNAPIDESKYDDRWDLLEIVTFNPVKARDGTVYVFKCPSGKEVNIPIAPNTKPGFRFCVKGEAMGTRRPDGRRGNLWVELHFTEIDDF